MQPDTELPKTPKIRKYTALLTQSGTAAPTAIVLQNTIGADVVWTRSSAGVYIGTCTGQLDYDKTTLQVSTNYGGGEKFSIYSWSAPDSIAVETQTALNVREDDLLANNMVEIRIYL